MRLFVPAFKGFFKNKKLKIYIIAISITFGIIISAIYSLYLFNEVYSDKIKNNIKNRVLYAGKTEISQSDIEDIRKIDGVEDVYRILANASLNFENDGITILTKSASIKEIPSIAEGTGFTDDKERKRVMKLDEKMMKELKGSLPEEDIKRNSEVIGKMAREVKPEKLSNKAYVDEKIGEFTKGFESANLSPKEARSSAIDLMNNIKKYYKKP